MKNEQSIKRHLKLFVNYLHEGVILIDNKKKISYINEAAKKILGLAKNSRSNTSLSSLVDNKNSDFYKLIDNSFETGKNVKNYELTFHKKIKTIRLLVSIIIIENSDDIKGRFLLIIFNDITSVWRLYLKERELLNHLRENYVHHMESLRQISDNIAHEVRNPIVSIGGYANLLYKKCNLLGDNNEEAKKYLNYILKDTERLDKLISQAEKYTDTKEIHLKAENFKKIIKDVMGYGNDLSKRHKINFEHSQLNNEKYIIYADKAKLQDALNSLVRQSVYLSKINSHLLVNMNFSPYNVEMSIDIYTNKISEVDAHYIFNPFFSVTEQEPNFDLAIAQRIIILHGGLIKVNLKNKHNLSFNISLPKEKRINKR